MLVNTFARPIYQIAVIAIGFGHRLEAVVGSIGSDRTFGRRRLRTHVALVGRTARRIGRHPLLVRHEIAAPKHLAEVHREDEILGLYVERNHVVEDRLAFDGHLHVEFHHADIGGGSRDRQFDLAAALAFDRSRVVLDRQPAAVAVERKGHLDGFAALRLVILHDQTRIRCDIGFQFTRKRGILHREGSVVLRDLHLDGIAARGAHDRNHGFAFAAKVAVGDCRDPLVIPAVSDPFGGIESQPGRRLLSCGVLTCHRCGPCPRHTDRDPGGRILIISHTHLVGIACQLAHLVGNVVGTTGNAKRQEQRGCSHPFR